MRDRGESRRLRGHQAIGYAPSKEWPAYRQDSRHPAGRADFRHAHGFIDREPGKALNQASTHSCRVAGFGLTWLGYLVGEKLVNYIRAADSDPSWEANVPKFAAEIRQIFTDEELKAYFATAPRIGVTGRRRPGHGCNRRNPVRARTGASSRRRDLGRSAVKQRRQSPRSRSKPRTTRAKYDCLDVLTGDEAQIVLKDLLSSRPDLISDARRAANAMLATVGSAARLASPRDNGPCRWRRECPLKDPRRSTRSVTRHADLWIFLRGSYSARSRTD
jgi:hypothetical protein